MLRLHSIAEPLAELPAELLLLIAEELPSARDVLALCRTCSRIAHLLAPLLLSLAVTHNQRALAAGGGSVLHFAVRSNNLRLARHLLAHGASANTGGGGGGGAGGDGASCGACRHHRNARLTPLHLAARNDHGEMAQLLLEHGAAVDSRCSITGATPLHRAPSPRMAELLLAFGADAAARNHRAQTPLHTACDKGLPDVVRVLLAHGAGNILHLAQAVDDDDYTYYACDRGGRGDCGVTPLHLAVRSGVAPAVDLLLREAPCAPDMLRLGGEALLRAAVTAGHAEVGRLLLAAGLDVPARNAAIKRRPPPRHRVLRVRGEAALASALRGLCNRVRGFARQGGASGGANRGTDGTASGSDSGGGGGGGSAGVVQT